MADITPFDWGARYDSPTFDSGPALQKAINYAANITAPDREGPYCEVNLAGRELMINTPISMAGMDKVTIANGRLTALPGLGASPIVTLGNGTPGGGSNYCNLHNLHLECSLTSSGVLINGATAQHFFNVRIHGMGSGCYGMRTQFNSGAGVYEKMNIQQRHAGEAGNDIAANRTAIGIDIGRADDIFIGCIVSYCAIPINLTSGPIQFSACHFFNGGTIDGVNLPIIVKTGTGGVGGNHLFTGCYLDKGVIRITDNFRAIFDGCHIINDDGQQTRIFDLITTAANETGRGFSVVGCEFIYNNAALTDGVVKYSTSGAGSWTVDKKITWNANRHADTADVPVALAQWQDGGCIDTSGRLIMGRTASQSLTGYHPNVQNVGTTEAGGSIATVAAVAGVSGSHVSLGKSRGNGKGAYAAILNNDRIGTVDFFGDDGVNLDTVGGLIKARAAANWGAAEHSTEVVISTRTGSGGLVDQMVVGNGVGFPASPLVPTAAPGDSSTKAASTAFVATSFAPTNNPTFTGTVNAPAAIINAGTLQVNRVGDAAGATSLIMSDVGFNRDFVYRTGAVSTGNRWIFRVNSSLESGANAGSDFVLNAYDDAGTLIGPILSAVRATAVLSLPKAQLTGRVARSRSGLTLVNGLNSNIVITTSYCRITGPTVGFSVGGFVPTLTDGEEVWLYNTTVQVMALVNEDTSSTAINRIHTKTGASVVLAAAESYAHFIYDGVLSRWVLLGSGVS